MEEDAMAAVGVTNFQNAFFTTACSTQLNALFNRRQRGGNAFINIVVVSEICCSCRV